MWSLPDHLDDNKKKHELESDGREKGRKTENIKTDENMLVALSMGLFLP